MITCPICDYHYSEKRSHCPTCGTEILYDTNHTIIAHPEVFQHRSITLAFGYERARQLPQSPRWFQTVD